MEEERIDLQENISEESSDTQEELTGEETQAQAADAADGCGAEGPEAEDGCEDAPAEEGDSKEEASSEKEEKQEALKEKIDELEDKVKRQMAEFDNFRKRTEKEKSAMFETGAKSVIEKILPVVDNFERGLAAIPEQEKGSAFAEGMEMIYKQLLTELEKMEVKPIPAVGEEFNPEFHNAVMQVESEEFESGVIAQELLKGYTYRDSVVRHSMVAVVS